MVLLFISDEIIISFVSVTIINRIEETADCKRIYIKSTLAMDRGYHELSVVLCGAKFHLLLASIGSVDSRSEESQERGDLLIIVKIWSCR